MHINGRPIESRDVMHSGFALLLLVPTLLISPAFGQIASSEPPAGSSIELASAESFAAASQRLIATMEAISKLEGSSPALAVIMVRHGTAPVIWVRGPLDVRASTMANVDTPFYIASQTKAFVGLLALKLHARGIFSLDLSLADVWPDLRLPDGADPRAIRFRQLLSHQGVVDNETLEFRTAYTDRVPARDYPRLLSSYSTVRQPGFTYRNVGYLIYGAALEKRTGRDWRDWLDDEIFRPAGMTRTGARASRFRRAELPLYHQWLGGSEWQTHRVKDDALMHAAGGLVTSPSDMARWLALQLGERPNVAHGEILAQSHTMQIAADTRNDVLNCQGYAIGWNICRIGAVDVRWHGGSYTAVRSAMAVSPQLGVGFAFLSNSNSLTGQLSQIATQVFFETIQNPNWDGPSPEALQAEFRTRLARILENRRNRLAQNRTEAQWEGWTWRPAPADLRRYVGRYRNERLGDLRIALVDSALRVELGAMRGGLEPAKPDLFGFAEGTVDPPVPFLFERTGRHVTALTWNGDHFRRVR